ncbi:MAG: TIGR03435 family protein [Bryobacteraceae bacterium]
MKPLLLSLLTLGALHAQTVDVAGTWQGALVAGQQQIRTVFKIERKDANLAATLFSIDQNPAPVPVAAISLQSGTVKFTIPALNANYEGKMAADGNSITGTVTQNGNPMTLNLVRATPQTAWAIPEPPPPPVQIAANATVHLEVATVKPSAPDARGRLYTFRGDQVMAINVSVINVITFAYDVHERQVSGLPKWASDEKFDIAIKPDTAGQPNLTQMKKLLQEVLVDRFQIKWHTEKRQLSVYAITLPAGTQHKMTKSAAQGSLPSLLYPRPGNLPGRNVTMAELAQSMQTAVLDRPVVDRTGIEGRYDFTLDWLPDETQFVSFGPLPKFEDNGKPSIFGAYQEQLGLKLEGTQALADVIVVDKLEKPGEN